ncbi:MAG: calcium/sodium antiporter [Phycisphaerales bacterium]|nr:calcium/sodium antiporter [Phycisphaerales bacterium]
MAIDLTDLVWLVVGLVMLIGGGHFLVGGASTLARRLGLSEFVVGLTVVAFGTSAPELAAGIGSVLNGSSGLIVGTVIGSNIANICLVLGASAMVWPLVCPPRAARKDAMVTLFVTIVGMIALRGGIGRLEAVALTAGILVYVALMYAQGRRDMEAIEDHEKPRGMILLDLIQIGVGLALLTFGSTKLIGAATSIAIDLEVSSGLIGLTIVAFGTSVPELAASLVAAARKKADIAVGNILGSNVFNTLAVLGISGLFGPIAVDEATMSRDIWMMLGATIALPVILILGRDRLTRSGGVVLVLSYVIYIALIGANLGP